MKMLSYDRIGLSEGTDLNKTSGSKEGIICHYWHFLGKEFRFQSSVCNGCHDVLISCGINNITILNIYGADLWN